MKNKGADMDDRNFKALTSLRAIYEQRACPPDEVLFAGKRSKEMEAHLGYCRYCNERLEMTAEDHSAWQELGDRLKPLIVGNGQNPSPAPGQIWSLDRERLGGWGPYDRYYNPPLVLVLQLQDKGHTVRVAQICAEEDLQGYDGVDVWLDEGIGFAESWNVYSIHRDNLNTCRSNIANTCAEQVLALSCELPPKQELRPLIRQFREFEIQVGGFIAMQALSQVISEKERIWINGLELIPGIRLVTEEAKEFVFDIANETLKLLRGTFKPAMVLRGSDMSSSADKLSKEQKNLVIEKCPIIPVNVNISENVLYIELKWLHSKQYSRYFISLFLLNIDLTESKYDKHDNNLVNIICKIPSVDIFCGLQVRRLTIALEHNIITIRLN